MTKKTVIRLALAMTLTLMSLGDSAQAQYARKSRATGIVVGFDKFASMAAITSAPQSQTLIISVVSGRKRDNSPSYLIAKMGSWHTDPPLPEEMFNGRSKWKFKLKRYTSCDSTLAEIDSIRIESDVSSDIESKISSADVSRITWISSKPAISESVKLPCYLLSSGDYELVK